MSEYASIPTERLIEVVAEASQELSRRPADELLAARAARLKRLEDLACERRLVEKALACIETRLGDSAPHAAAVPERASDELTRPAETLPMPGPGPEHEPDLEVSSDASSPGEETKPEHAAPQPAVAVPRPKPRTSSAAAPARVSVRDREAKVLSVIVSANRPLSKQQVAERAGMTTDEATTPLQRLVAAGKIKASGATKARRFEAAGHQPHTEHGARTAAGRKRSAAKIDGAVARVGLRDRVMKAVSADPAALDNHRLALALDVDLEDVSDACSWLVGKGRLQMHRDGTYLRSVTEAAGEVAAA